MDVLAYVRALYEAVCSPDVRESAQVQKMKKYMNYLGVGVEPSGQFLHQIRRVTTTADFFRLCEEFLDHDQPMPLEPFAPTLKDDGPHGRRAALTDAGISTVPGGLADAPPASEPILQAGINEMCVEIPVAAVSLVRVMGVAILQ